MINIKQQIDHGSGFSIVNMDKEESKFIKKQINNQFNEVLSANGLKKTKFEDYHKEKLSDDLHKSLWTRENRNGSKKLSKFLTESKLLKNLSGEFKDLEFSREVDKNKPDIYWRIVRPNKSHDVGPIHADEWFWDSNKWNIPKGKTCLKIWMMLSEGINEGLSMIEGSQKKNNWIYEKVYKDGLYKPEFNIEKNQFDLKKVYAPFGKAIAFNYKTLHCGVLNTFNVTRVSVEFTLFYRS